MNILLIIDPQNDFCKPADENGLNQGALYVPGAEQDMKRLAYWILANSEEIDHIAVTLDSHFVNDISHPGFWQNENGQHPKPFTQITFDDVQDGKWTPLFVPERAKEYLKRLEQQKDYTHVVWPEHCLVGSEGAAIYKPVFDAINNWSRQGKFFQPIIKGEYPFAEHFGAFAAQVIFDDVPDTKVNDALIDELGEFDNIYIAGEAKSHCVAQTIKQLIYFAPGLVSKLKILTDTMSNVPGFENVADAIYEEAKNLGAKFITTAEEL
jgi:nicotinamidase-related amidase